MNWSRIEEFWADENLEREQISLGKKATSPLSARPLGKSKEIQNGPTLELDATCYEDVASRWVPLNVSNFQKLSKTWSFFECIARQRMTSRWRQMEWEFRDMVRGSRMFGSKTKERATPLPQNILQGRAQQPKVVREFRLRGIPICWRTRTGDMSELRAIILACRFSDLTHEPSYVTGKPDMIRVHRAKDATADVTGSHAHPDTTTSEQSSALISEDGKIGVSDTNGKVRATISIYIRISSFPWCVFLFIYLFLTILQVRRKDVHPYSDFGETQRDSPLGAELITQQFAEKDARNPPRYTVPPEGLRDVSYQPWMNQKRL